MRVKVKICGVRRIEDLRRSFAMGADYVGCVLAPDSPRTVDAATLDALVRACGDAERCVLVTRGVPIDAVKKSCRRSGLRRVQPHGISELDLRVLEDAGLIVHRVYTVTPQARALPVPDPRPTAERPALLDGGRGGAGRTFDWSLLAPHAPSAMFVAGGIDAVNIQRLLAHRPFGIDVSSGVEARPGVKDPRALERLFAAVEEVS